MSKIDLIRHFHFLGFKFFNKFKVNEIHEMDKENIEIQFFTAAIIILIAPKVKKMVGIVACVAVLPVDSVRCVWGSRRESVSVLLADNIELPLSAHPTQIQTLGHKLGTDLSGVESRQFCLTTGNAISIHLHLSPCSP